MVSQFPSDSRFENGRTRTGWLSTPTAPQCNSSPVDTGHLRSGTSLAKKVGTCGEIWPEHLHFAFPPGDSGLEPKLTLDPIDSRIGEKFQSHIYAAPKLFLNGVQLRTGARVWTGEFKNLPHVAGRPTMGILGMDCLTHYCLQASSWTLRPKNCGF
jgi:hypothetical protein